MTQLARWRRTAEVPSRLSETPRTPFLAHCLCCVLLLVFAVPEHSRGAEDTITILVACTEDPETGVVTLAPDQNEFPDCNVGTCVCIFNNCHLPLGIPIAGLEIQPDQFACFECSGRNDTFEIVVLPNRGSVEIVELVEFKRGDCNVDDSADLSDTVFLLAYLFRDSGAIACADACDVNDDGRTDIADAIYPTFRTSSAHFRGVS